jgi:endonuclease YncB( thermonuclease family)
LLNSPSSPILKLPVTLAAFFMFLFSLRKTLTCLLISYWSISLPAFAQKPLKTYEKCQFHLTPWGDGDSFEVQPPMGEPFTVRLYGADCIEWHITDTTLSRRLRAQRAYFGISEIDPDPQKAAEIAKDFGKEAAAYVAKRLEKPFTVHTAEADARGGSTVKRVYAFIVTADGKDLSEELIALGLARAFGVVRETYHQPPISGKEYAAQLEDYEWQAAMSKKGIWAKTDWSQLPDQRKMQREEEAKDLIGIDQVKGQLKQPIDPNKALKAELMKLPTIGETTANRIIANRPYRKAEDLLKVPGIGEKTLSKIRPHLTFGPLK